MGAATDSVILVCTNHCSITHFLSLFWWKRLGGYRLIIGNVNVHKYYQVKWGGASY